MMIDIVAQHIARESRASIEQEDVRKLLLLAMPEKPKIVMEIGMFHGWSAKNWIDAFNPELFIGIDNCNKPEQAHEVKGEQYHYLWGHDSHTAYTELRVADILYQQVDFLFIDGDHTIEGVTADFEIYSKYVRDGGIIAFHDILFLKQECNVKPLWEKLKKKYYYVEMIGGPASTGMGVIFKTPLEGAMKDG